MSYLMYPTQQVGIEQFFLRNKIVLGSKKSRRELVQSTEMIYSNHLETGLVWYSNVRFVSGCCMVQYLNDGL